MHEKNLKALRLEGQAARLSATQAEADLVAALDAYIAQASGSFQTAFSFTERLRSACFKLVDFPDRGAPRDDITAGLRILTIERKTVVAYFVRRR